VPRSPRAPTGPREAARDSAARDSSDPARYPRVVLASVSLPWAADGSLIEDLFRDQVQLHLAAGVKHLYVFGTAGEGYAVTDRQFDQVCALFDEEMRADDAHPMVGVISLSTGTIIERIERAIDRGFHTFQISLPAWGALNDRELAAFFREVVGRFPAARFVHYNLQRSGRVLTPSDYVGLAAAHPNLVAAKNGTGNLATIHGLLREVPMLRHFLTELGYPQGCQLGRPGYLMSLTTMNPSIGIRFFEAGVRGDLARLFGLQAEALEVFAQLVGRAGAEVGTGALAGGPHMDGAYEKVLAKVFDERMPLRLLPPYQQVREEAFADFRQGILERLPSWLPGPHRPAEDVQERRPA
jgi:dihydrodipicolinate synthase/N-acetylneuraminate lyase